jgi:hypothetical protein
MHKKHRDVKQHGLPFVKNLTSGRKRVSAGPAENENSAGLILGKKSRDVKKKDRKMTSL